MKLFYTLLFSVILCGISYGQKATIRGFVYDKSDGEPVAFQKVRLLKQDSSLVTGTTTDLDGFFSLAGIDRGNYILKLENSAYQTIFENVKVTKPDEIIDLNYQFEKRKDVLEIEEIEVTADDIRKKNEVLIGTVKLDQKQIERIPSVGAENDIVGAFSVTPGVTTTGDQGGQIYVRGGTPIQNKILLDGMTIYSPFHSIGFFSIFETELVKSAEIYTGGFDAMYGGRISSIMDITYRDGNGKKLSGKVSVSPFMGKAVLEGPLYKPKSGSNSGGTFIFSAKQSLIDKTSDLLYSGIKRGDSLGTGMPFSFTDLYGKVTFKGDGGSKFSAFGFHNRDKVNYDIANIDWTQSGGGMNFILVPGSSPIFIKGHVNGSYYATNFNEIISEADTVNRFSSIGGFDMGFDFTYFVKNGGEFNYGINFNGFKTDYHTYNEAGQRIEDNNFSTEIGIYGNYRLVTTRWVIQPSIRVQSYASYNVISPEPRLGIKFNANEKLRLKASGGRYSQNFTSASSDKDVVNLFNGLLSAPTNVQSNFVTMYGNERHPNNGIQYAWHAIGGFEYDLSKRLMLNVEGYYKYFSQLSNINQNKLYEETPEFSYIDDIYKKDFILENGESFGVDVLLKYNGKRLFLWGVYSFGYSRRWDGFEFYFPVFDRRHNINLVGTYLFGKDKDLELSVRWNLGSGLPFTPNAGSYQEENFATGVTTDPTTSNSSYVATILGDFNSERLPYYHRLDITAKKQFNFSNNTTMEIIASVTNAYNRKNIFYVNRVTGNVIYQFPILPSLGVSYKF